MRLKSQLNLNRKNEELTRTNKSYSCVMEENTDWGGESTDAERNWGWISSVSD